MFTPATRNEFIAYEFGSFRLHPREALLLNENGDVVQLTPKVFDTLLALVEQAGHVVARNDLMQRLWPDTAVEDSSLAQNVSLLRRALAEGNGGERYIETIPKRGYRFAVPVRMVVDHQVTTAIVSDSFDSSARVVQTKTRGVSYLTQAFLVIGLCVLVAVALYLYSSYRAESPGEVGSVQSIAVLPFKTIGSQKQEDLMGLGMADSLIIRLSQLDQTRILPTSSVVKYTNGDRNPALIGRDLGVEAILDGTVQRDGDRIRVTAQLIRSSDGQTLWSGKFDENYHNIFHLQDLVSEELAVSLHPGLRRERKHSSAPTINVAAYQDYLTGMYFWNIRSRDNLPKAINYLEQAVQNDPKFAQAYAVLADSYFLGFQPEYEILPQNEALEKAEKSAQRALDLNENIPEAHVVKARVFTARSNFSEADREFRKALEIDGDSAITRLRYGCFLFYSLTNLSEALLQVSRARELDPVSPVVNYKYACLLFMSRDYDGAIKYSKLALALQPDVPNARLLLGTAYVQKHMFSEALAEFEKASQDPPRKVLRNRAILYGIWGRRKEALKAIAEIKRFEGPDDPIAVAAVYGALGQKDKAFETLLKVPFDPSTAAMLHFDPQLDSLRNDPRFSEILRKSSN